MHSAAAESVRVLAESPGARLLVEFHRFTAVMLLSSTIFLLTGIPGTQFVNEARGGAFVLLSDAHKHRKKVLLLSVESTVPPWYAVRSSSSSTGQQPGTCCHNTR